MLFLTLLQPAQEQQDKLLVMEVTIVIITELTVKTQYQRHQKNLPFTGASGDILTLKIKFKINGTLVADEEVFSLGLKSVFDASNTQTIVTANDEGQRNGEVLSIHNDASNLLKIR